MKLYIPISIKTVSNVSMFDIVDYCKRCKPHCVFFCDFPKLSEVEELNSALEKYEKHSKTIKEMGIQVGVWLYSFGHGAPLSHEKKATEAPQYTKIRGFGIFGNGEPVYCPLDENFKSDYGKYVQKFAVLHPDMIMLDDDFRLSMRGYGIGCACKLHMAAMRKEVMAISKGKSESDDLMSPIDGTSMGYEPNLSKKRITENYEWANKLGIILGRKWLFNKIFCGKPNLYRKAWLKVSKDSLMNFAKYLREKVNEIDGNIRLGTCICLDTWDISGVDAVELARAFAGRTMPFLRTIGAPYWVTNSLGEGNLAMPIELTRQELAHCAKSGVEVFTEGDVYPRPRYIVPAAYLESYDLALATDVHAQGILKYMFEYEPPIESEQGYLLHHEMNAKLKARIAEMFKGKRAVGVYVYDEPHKFKHADMRRTARDTSKLFPYDTGNKLKDFCIGIGRRAENIFTKTYQVSDIVNFQMVNRAQMIFAENGIPTTYVKDAKMPIVLLGENARKVPTAMLNNGVILDVEAAKILSWRGVDVGFAGTVKEKYRGISFPLEGGKVSHSDVCAVGLLVAKKATAIAYYEPQKHIAAYRYENEKGMRFFVLGLDLYNKKHVVYNPFFNSYQMQNMLRYGIEWAGKNKLPATCPMQPKLYIQTAVSDKSGDLAVGIFNFGVDTVIKPTINLAESFAKAEFLNGEGRLEGDKILCETNIAPFGFMGVILKKQSLTPPESPTKPNY